MRTFVALLAVTTLAVVLVAIHTPLWLMALTIGAGVAWIFRFVVDRREGCD